MNTTIEIIKIPDGTTPEEVRREWVGLQLPCIGIKDEQDGVTFEVDRDIAPGTLRDNVFIVPQEQAISILKEKSPMAAMWFEDHGMPIPLCSFTFAHDEAKFVGPIN